MKRLRCLLILFCAALTVPLAYFVVRTEQGLAQEEEAELRYFAETLFDRMEGELQALVTREEARAIDDYHPFPAFSGRQASPLATQPSQPYILGYLQNSPDGALQTPLSTPSAVVLAELQHFNTLFNQKRRQIKTQASSVSSRLVPGKADPLLSKKVQADVGPASRYLRVDRAKREKSTLGQKKKRVENVSLAQVRNLVQAPLPLEESLGQGLSLTASEDEADAEAIAPIPAFEAKRDVAHDEPKQVEKAGITLYTVEVAPLQSLLLDEQHLFLFRRVMVAGQIYRQGLILDLEWFAHYLGKTYFVDQPLAVFSRLEINRINIDLAVETVLAQFGQPIGQAIVTVRRVFPRPFAFLSLQLRCAEIPRSSGRNTLLIMSTVLAAVILLGLMAIDRSVRVVVALSEQRTGFVSAVTHELKTPLTNIRLYIEMLAQGMVKNKSQEQAYFQVISSESTRLTRLINNVLIFAQLEKGCRQMQQVKGDLSEVITEVKAVMVGKMTQEGFSLEVVHEPGVCCCYDRESMVQVLINLLDNSIKFSHAAEGHQLTLAVRRDNDQVLVSVSDEGPGIPPAALKKVFSNFYRVDNALTRQTQGTGIGLALVKKMVEAMGGQVVAENNRGKPGATLKLWLPLFSVMK